MQSTISGLVGKFDANDRAIVISPKKLIRLNAYLNLEPKVYQADSLNGWVDSQGELVIDLRGGAWRTPEIWNDQIWILGATPWEVPMTEYGVRYGHYVVAREYQPTWIRQKLDAFSTWLGVTAETTDPVPECRCYHKDGKLIWSSIWIRFETKCLIVLGISMLVALLLRPRKRKTA